MMVSWPTWCVISALEGVASTTDVVATPDIGPGAGPGTGGLATSGLCMDTRPPRHHWSQSHCTVHDTTIATIVRTFTISSKS